MRRVGPPRVWVVVDGAGGGGYSVHRTREMARQHAYFWGSRVVPYRFATPPQPVAEPPPTSSSTTAAEPARTSQTRRG
jgi:hypothetical protein